MNEERLMLAKQVETHAYVSSSAWQALYGQRALSFWKTVGCPS
jgi:hypothetical protein